MGKLKVIVATSAFLGIFALGTALVAQQRPGNVVEPIKGVDSTVKSLIEARLGLAKNVYELTMASTRGASLDDMPVWSRRWMDEQIGLDPNDPVKKLAAILGHLNRTRDLEAMAAAHKESARGTLAQALKMKYYRLEAEQMLEEIRVINPGLFTPKPAGQP